MPPRSSSDPRVISGCGSGRSPMFGPAGLPRLSAVTDPIPARTALPVGAMSPGPAPASTRERGPRGTSRAAATRVPWPVRAGHGRFRRPGPARRLGEQRRWEQADRAELLSSEIELPPRFFIALPIPTELPPISTADGRDLDEIVQSRADVEILPGRRTEIFGYEGHLPGSDHPRHPRAGTVARHTNELDVPTVVHLHGGHTREKSDGYRVDFVLPVGSNPDSANSVGGQACTIGAGVGTCPWGAGITAIRCSSGRPRCDTTSTGWISLARRRRPGRRRALAAARARARRSSRSAPTVACSRHRSSSPRYGSHPANASTWWWISVRTRWVRGSPCATRWAAARPRTSCDSSWRAMPPTTR